MSFEWYTFLPSILADRVGPEAGDSVRQAILRNVKTFGLEGALHRPLENLGLLSLVVRNGDGLSSWFVSNLAAGNDWMWRYGNLYELQGLFWCGLAVAVVRFGVLFLANFLAGLTVLEAVTRLRRAVYHHTYRLGALAFQTDKSNEAIDISSRHLESVHDGLFVWLTTYFREPIKVGLLVLFALAVDFWLALAIFLLAGLVAGLAGPMASFFRRRGRSAGARANHQLGLLQESLTILGLVKMYLMEKFNQVRVERQLAAYHQARLRRYIGEAFFRPLFILLGLTAVLILGLVAGIVLLNGRLGMASFLVLTATLVSLYWPTVAWLQGRRVLRRARESAQTAFAFLDRPGSVGQMVGAEFLPGLNALLEFDNVKLKDPASNKMLLEDIDLTIEAGQQIALMGRENAEKHALVYLIPRFLDPTHGEIRIDRKNLRFVTLDSLRAQVGVVLQNHLIFNDTIANNIGCGEPTYTLPKIIEAAKVAHAHQFIQRLPQGYETVVGEMGHRLTAGEKFRIGLARALMRDPSLYVIEEPLMPLDADTKTLLDDTFSRILPDHTVIFLPHRLSTIRNCDRIVVLDEGKIVAEGDHASLLETSDLYRHLQYQEFNEFAGRA